MQIKVDNFMEEDNVPTNKNHKGLDSKFLLLSLDLDGAHIFMAVSSSCSLLQKR